MSGSGPPAFVYREPAPPGGAGALAWDVDTPYGPDDPAYGPPAPEWYARDKDAGQEDEAAASAAAGELQHARGPFEPVRHDGGSGQELTPYQPHDAAEDDPDSAGANALDQLKDFYLTAEAIGPENLDRHIEQLLERQRQLISEYFTQTALEENAR